jgi:hypothetical protein
MASFSRALRDLDDVQGEVRKMKRQAQADGQTALHTKLRRLESTLEDVERELKSLKRDLD